MDAFILVGERNEVDEQVVVGIAAVAQVVFMAGFAGVEHDIVGLAVDFEAYGYTGLTFCAVDGYGEYGVGSFVGAGSQSRGGDACV